MIWVIDNYDSFTYNLVQYLQILGAEVRVSRNDAVALEEIRQGKPKGIVLSPGPGRPESAGITLALLGAFTQDFPILGVCLGHQAIGMAFGGQVVNSQHLMHGKVSTITTDGKGIFQGIRSPFQAMRYHSLALSRETFPESLEVTAEADDGEIMGVRHKEHPVEGIQFHPESIMTPVGKRILRNFLNRAAG